MTHDRTTHPTAIPLPVTAATCLEDRAHLERTARLGLAPGTHRLRLGPLTPLAVDHTLRTELGSPDGQVLDARLVRSWEPRPVGPDEADSPLRRRLHELRAAFRAGSAEQQRVAARLALLGQLSEELLREVAEGTGLGAAEPDLWAAELDGLGAEQDEQAERQRELSSRLAQLAAQERQVAAALEETESRPLELRCFLELTVQAEAAVDTVLTVRHLTACALWRPAYRAVLGDGRLRLASDAVVWQATGEDWTDVRLTLSTARSALAAEPPLLHEDRLTLRPLTAEERRTVAVEVREEEIATLGAAGPEPTSELPGVDDRGEVRVLTAPAPASVPGDGRAHRVPLGSFTGRAAAELVAAPELSPLVSEVVSVRNESGGPLLAGPVELVRESGYLGRGELPYTAPGAVVELAFPGSDEYRLVREVVEEQGSAGLPVAGRRSTVTRTVRVHVSRPTAPGVTGEQVVTVRERIPVSEVSAVQVRLHEQSCDPRPAELDAEGIVSWRLPLAPNARRTVTLVYEVAASTRVTGL
ncbi:mucoidy inhibitor MuiA family protein [Kitasatospora acidiphila]|uniref:Mucoidy inhibitor MuiA family protein n=1 Tax=Kitasatospora acidiphila TaxID=2567942 RepID=A0A540W1H3_9ACTN|nr:mucoidy inhibitor MuiA family protein [Kitasatospora acidiphila]TQF02879.1 mucoidy inhibitor MuiA family protein [Kitasatospora acidiphila]